MNKKLITINEPQKQNVVEIESITHFYNHYISSFFSSFFERDFFLLGPNWPAQTTVWWSFVMYNLGPMTQFSVDSSRVTACCPDHLAVQCLVSSGPASSSGWQPGHPWTQMCSGSPAVWHCRQKWLIETGVFRCCTNESAASQEKAPLPPMYTLGTTGFWIIENNPSTNDKEQSWQFFYTHTCMHTLSHIWNRMRPKVLMQNQQTRELISASDT